MGWTKPRHEKPILRFLPLGAEFETIATDVGRQSETAIPCIARNIMSSIPVRARPHAMIKPPVSKQPARLTRRVPTASAIEPARRRQELLVRLLMFSDSTAHYPVLHDQENLLIYARWPK
jgi:hypothetical protein